MLAPETAGNAQKGGGSMSRTYRRGRDYQGFKLVPERDCHAAGNRETCLKGDRVADLWGTVPANRWAKRHTNKQRRRADARSIRDGMDDYTEELAQW